MKFISFRHIPENTFSKSAYAFNTRQSWLNFSKPHLRDCWMMNLNNFSIIGNNVNWEVPYERTFLFILKVSFFLSSLLSLKAAASLWATSKFIKGHSLWIKSTEKATCFFTSATLTTPNICTESAVIPFGTLKTLYLYIYHTFSIYLTQFKT